MAASVQIKVKTDPVKMGMTVVRGESVPPYKGDYVVEPLLDEDQTLETAGKKMLDDMTVKGMAVRIVHDPAGGLVYYIGKTNED